ncbi:hypothetical protein [Blastopirellula marina]|uniref:Uncharacterized protein n=1 Tax=Blastopirellula marina TaxID=124 RepID=A0A2S8GIP4_9BACT|nr:hypothetical protein [Blastopirellula marina]PQO44322.1 hypothetical protein C5Y93_20390 [Blastopirellula marina]
MFVRISRTSLVLLSLLAITGGCGQRSAPNNEEPAAPVLTAFGDFAFQIPHDWFIARTNTPQTQAFFVHLGEDGQVPDGIFKVDVGTPVLPTILATAQEFAGDDGKLTEGLKVAGADAIQVETPSETNHRPRVIVVCQHNDKLYLIMGSREGKLDLNGPLEQVLSTWQWAD